MNKKKAGYVVMHHLTDYVSCLSVIGIIALVTIAALEDRHNPCGLIGAKLVFAENAMIILVSLLAITKLIELSTEPQKTFPVNIFLRCLKSTFPEEAVADLVAFRNRLSQSKIPRRIIYWKLFIEVLKLIPDIHIQIKIENLWLPPGNRRVDK
jgi:hypothetical protein